MSSDPRGGGLVWAGYDNSNLIIVSAGFRPGIRNALERSTNSDPICNQGYNSSSFFKAVSSSARSASRRKAALVAIRMHCFRSLSERPSSSQTT
jgi:hypothetical protein